MTGTKLLTSLFVVSLPRSLSTYLYQLSRRALGLEEPSWTSDGEILNLERHGLRSEGQEQEGDRFTHPGVDSDCFERWVDFLGRSVRAEGFAYKDVVQPFVAAHWLPGSGLDVLKIERSLPEVAFAMLNRNWLYPARAVGVGERASVNDLIRGLLLAQEALARLPGVAVSFDDLIFDEQVLAEALRSFDGGKEVAPPRYLDSDFCRLRDAVLTRRETPEYQRIAALCAAAEG